MQKKITNFNKNLPENYYFCTTNLKSKYFDVNNEDCKKYFFNKLLQKLVFDKIINF